MNKNKKRIVIVEDDEHISKIYEMKFAKEGFDVFFARDGEEGMVKIIAEKPDLIVLDLMLPLRDGFALLEDIKNIPSLVHVPVIVLSNLGGKIDIERTLALGAKQHIVKINHSVEEVVSMVKEYLIDKV